MHPVMARLTVVRDVIRPTMWFSARGWLIAGTPGFVEVKHSETTSETIDIQMTFFLLRCTAVIISVSPAVINLNLLADCCCIGMYLPVRTMQCFQH